VYQRQISNVTKSPS
jgi:hypothetical protein